MFDINKCKECYEIKCLIFKAIFNADIEIKQFEKKINKLRDKQEHYKYQYNINAYNKGILSQNQINILKITLEQEVKIGKEIRELKSKFYNYSL